MPARPHPRHLVSSAQWGLAASIAPSRGWGWICSQSQDLDGGGHLLGRERRRQWGSPGLLLRKGCFPVRTWVGATCVHLRISEVRRGLFPWQLREGGTPDMRTLSSLHIPSTPHTNRASLLYNNEYNCFFFMSPLVSIGRSSGSFILYGELQGFIF